MLCTDAAYVPTDLRERLAAPLLKRLTRLALKPMLSPNVPIPAQRRRLRQVTRHLPHARDVDIAPAARGGVAGEWLTPRNGNNATGSILFLHGGAYCIGSAATHRALTTHLARAAALPVFAADYRLAPEHPFPAAVDDAVAACRALAAQGAVVIAGDSAGAGLALATALSLRQSGLAMPAALVLFSPWVDLTVAALDDAAAPDEVVLSAAWLGACARHYLAGQNAKSPLASPLFADLTGLPPVLMQTSPGELLYRDAERLDTALEKAGVATTCEVVPARWHDFQTNAGLIPSARAALARAGRFIAAACVTP
jgi:acetyl esterase/lipase